MSDLYGDEFDLGDPDSWNAVPERKSVADYAYEKTIVGYIVRMITRAEGNMDIHEISDFERDLFKPEVEML